MKLLPFILNLILLMLLGNANFAQQKEQNERQKRIKFYTSSLQADSLKASQVVTILDTYKSGMVATVNDKSLNPEDKKARIKALIIKKNKELKAILSIEQQKKVIPATETD